MKTMKKNTLNVPCFTVAGPVYVKCELMSPGSTSWRSMVWTGHKGWKAGYKVNNGKRQASRATRLTIISNTHTPSGSATFHN